MSHRGPPPAPPEPYAEVFLRLRERFVAQCAVQASSWPPLDRTPHRGAAALLAETAGAPPFALGQPGAEGRVAAWARALAVAEAQAGEAGVAFVRAAAETWSDLATQPVLLHGTGSWALAGILREGALVPGGDGMTGEVALSGTPQEALYVCDGFTPGGVYSAAAFACSNAGTTGEELRVSSVRAAHVGWMEWLAVLLFSRDPPAFTPATRAFAAGLRRYRNLARDEAMLGATDTVAARLRAGALQGDGREYTRGLPADDDHEGLVRNVLFLVTEWMSRDADLMRLPARGRLAAGVARHLDRVRGTLACPLPGDPPDVAATKLARLEALRQQFPVVLALDATGVSTEIDPGYPLSMERLVRTPIPVQATRVAFVPDERRDEVTGRLAAAGVGARVLPFEALEAWRLAAEAATPEDPG